MWRMGESKRACVEEECVTSIYKNVDGWRERETLS